MKNADLINTAQLPYGHTNIVNREWIEATKIVGRKYTESEIKRGWPLAMEPHRLANLQCPGDSTGQTFINTAMVSACEREQVKCTAFVHDDYGLLPGGGKQRIGSWTDYAIEAKAFSAWLTSRDTEPSPHIAAWFKAAGVGRLRSVPDTNVEPANWLELVAFRKAHPGVDWTVKQKNVLSKEFDRRVAIPDAKGVAKCMAAELLGVGGKFLSVKRFNELKATKDASGKRATSARRAA